MVHRDIVWSELLQSGIYEKVLAIQNVVLV